MRGVERDGEPGAGFVGDRVEGEQRFAQSPVVCLGDLLEGDPG